MTKRFLVILAFLGGFNLYTLWRLAHWAPWPPLQGSCLWAAAGGAMLLQVLAFRSHIFTPAAYYDHPRLAKPMRLLGLFVFTLVGVFLCLFGYVFLADLLGFLWQVFHPEADLGHLQYRAVVTATGLTIAAGLVQALGGPRIFEADVPVEDLPPDLDGFRIVQVSDLHVGALIGEDYTRRVVEKANALGADIVALTGDFIDGTVRHLERDVAPLAELKAKDGVFFVLGNHEYYWGAKAWAEHFKKLGARVLLNDHEIVRRGAAQIAIAGVTDYMTRGWEPPERWDPFAAARGIPGGAFKILLNHQPSGYDKAAKAGFDLQLSGHTHGGQFLPWSLLVGLFHRYYTGLHRHNKMWVYVSRGTGFWGPPLRAGVPAEITVLTLRRNSFT